MTNDIILAGVGGQGILTIAAIVGRAAMERGLNVKQSEVHGMAQRGGAVVAHLRLSTETIYSDLIAEGAADVVLGIEPMEALRQAPCLGPRGVLLANTEPIRNIPDYPDAEALVRRLRTLPRSVVLDAGAMAKEAGSSRAMNMVMLGALSPYLGVGEEDLRGTIVRAFAAKGDEVVQTNLRAFAAGKAAATRTW
ncbi:MAG: indolepyruvate oxidoreductase subunit beta [Lentisphaeria bacterium]|nr:indolepyruvate oxidoreductase subunit beta [Lentisphaeria bacterium]